MSATNRAEVSNRNAVIAAILYLATFLAIVYGGVALIRHESFMDAFLFALPRALIACAAFYLCTLIREHWQSNSKHAVKQTQRPAIEALPR